MERRSLKKNQGFNGIRTRDLRDTGAMFYQLSYEATHWLHSSHFTLITRLRRNHDFLKLLAKCTPAQRKAILKESDDALVRTICECILNVLKETVPVSKPPKKKLVVRKKPVIALAEKSTPLEKKKKILVQHGGNFLSVLLPPVLRAPSSSLV